MTEYWGDWITPAVEPNVRLYGNITPAKAATSIPFDDVAPLDAILDDEIASIDDPTIASRNYEEWPFVVNDPPALNYINGDAGLRFRTWRYYDYTGLDYLQQISGLRPDALHPALRGSLPPGAIGVTFDGPPSGVVGAWALDIGWGTPGVGDDGDPVAIPSPYKFELRADHSEFWSTVRYESYEINGRYYYGFTVPSEYDPLVPIPDPSSWEVKPLNGDPEVPGVDYQGIVNEDGSVDAYTSVYFDNGQLPTSLWLGITNLGDGIPGHEDYATYQWRMSIAEMMFRGQVTWPPYRYLYESESNQGGRWNKRQRQTPAGNTGGWPSRHLQNAGATGTWQKRSRQTGA